METKMETGHLRGRLQTDTMVLLSLGLRLFPDELAFNHTSRLDIHNRQRHSLWGPVTWP